VHLSLLDRLTQHTTRHVSIGYTYDAAGRPTTVAGKSAVKVRGQALFSGKAQCASCRVPLSYSTT
jgi:YD repeat-containing protein